MFLKKKTAVCHSGPAASQLSSSRIENNDDKEITKAERAKGVLVLLTVPVAWGTYAPVVRYVYEIDPPVPGVVFSAGYYIIASVTLMVLMMVQSNQQVPAVEPKEDAKDVPLPIQAGFELGSYLFLGNIFQIIGLKTVPVDRAAFLVQLTTVMVPLTQAVIDGNLLAVPIRTWTACLLAFAGVVVMGLDGQDLQTNAIFSSLTNSFTTGDLLIVLAAFSYTLHVVRLGRYAKFTTPLSLAASKASVEALFSVLFVAGLLAISSSSGNQSGLLTYLNQMGNEVSSFSEAVSDGLSTGTMTPDLLLPAVGACFWTGWVTCAYTIYAQSFGQSRVNPTDSNLIYSTQPIFSAIFAFAILNESLGPIGFFGGALIASSLWLVAAVEGNDSDDNTKSIEEKEVSLLGAEVDSKMGAKENADVSLLDATTKRS